MAFKKVCVLGLGYIGLPTSVSLSNHGHSVYGVDKNTTIVDQLNRGNSHIFEPGVNEALKKAIQNKKFTATLKPTHADVYIICVPTPLIETERGKFPNNKFVMQAISEILPVIKKGNMIIIESTCPVGTTKLVVETIEAAGFNVKDYSIGYCPERVLPGDILNEFVENDRVVGGVNAQDTKEIAKFYSSFVKGKIHETNCETAEMCKLTENSFRDVNIAFANELSLICHEADIDIYKLIELANQHPRVNILQPGPGVGGHCIAVDPWFIVSQFTEKAKLIRSAREVNDNKTNWVIANILEAVKRLQSTKSNEIVVCCLGLTFKPNIDDLRGSPAIKIAEGLKNKNIKTLFVEPNLNFIDKFDLSDKTEAIQNSDLVVCLVRHNEFVDRRIQRLIKSKVFLDYCNLFDHRS